ncbi:PVC-type heme-binding CxxCH protein [Albibacterium bauzanense]|uniref:Putative membrane-bound dehydrogenase-like protein n=1 Tax=Albibacterium bauzanense TaxID=653929 RepID=A0A4R1M3N7_9SPHI|nr:PVC-type heme-binding CxxCH protein [Albibacterium bauzanense]TCK85852.1 putative membrane-bound dehydrogenase-like protein [Albibacterium bauzanense]
MKINKRRYLLLAKIAVVLLPVGLFLKACTTASSKESDHTELFADSLLTEAQKRLPENAVRGLKILPGLDVKLMASEPMLINPTNIDVDERGRVWVTEAYNYRFEINGNKARPEGDRILILEDKDGDGVLETSTVFYQGPEINAPLGITVLGDRVLVSQSPYVWAFFDDNNDGKADRKEILFQGIGGDQHDHGMHSFIFGPDGKLYFNFGNSGTTLKDKNNNVVLDQDGDEIGPDKYTDGMVFRSDPDGSNVEVMGYNFRNPYEPAVDSYGTVWQSDNDDDGNKAVRINYVMEFGNFGFKDEMTGAAWGANRINIEDSIPVRHWHQNDPGVIPNLLYTGSGSPTGMVIYEGSLLPKQFQGQMIHAEPGHNVIRSYPVKKNGAGYSAEVLNILTGDDDQWFRPSDVSVAPDGSLIIADWYDPGVGGHQVGDLQRGRIYRIAPSALKDKYTVPTQDYTTPEGALIALQNPNNAIRRHAFLALQAMGSKAISALEKQWKSAPDPRMRARALWILSKTPNGEKYIAEAIKDRNPDLRITGLRAARQLDIDITMYVKLLVKDQDPQVRRESAIALRHSKLADAPGLWATLAMQHNGNDRWYLEALGIGADGQWDSYFSAYLKEVKNPLTTAAGRDIVWRARTNSTLPFLKKLAIDANVPLKSRLRYFRAFDFIPGEEKVKTLLALLEENNGKDVNLSALVLRLLTVKDVANSEIAKNAIKDVLKTSVGTQEYLNLLRQYEITTENAQVLNMVVSNGDTPVGVNAARLLFQLEKGQDLKNAVSVNETEGSLNVLEALGMVGNTESVEILSQVALSESYSMTVRNKAVEMIGKSRVGQSRVMELLKSSKLPADLISSAVAGLSGSRTPGLYEEAKTFLPGVSTTESTSNSSVSLDQLLALTGNSVNGQAVFSRACFVCHQVNGAGLDFGPALSEIGSKLPKQGLYDAIVHPSSGVSFGYEGWQIEMKDGSILVGIISSRTETDIEIKYSGGATQKIKTSDVKEIKKLPGSLMPEMAQTFTNQEFADLLEYLSSLKSK